MKLKFFYSIFTLVLILFLQACGSSNSSSSDTDIDKPSHKTSTITEANYISLAKFHFSKESRELLKTTSVKEENDKKFRSYPGAGETSPSTIDNSLKITTITPFNNYIESMMLSHSDETIKVEVKNKIYVIVSLYRDNKLVKSATLTMHEFQNFDMPSEGAKS